VPRFGDRLFFINSRYYFIQANLIQHGERANKREDNFAIVFAAMGVNQETATHS
jgi:vacuolar-type H+-ATPase subunit B/Vma2